MTELRRRDKACVDVLPRLASFPGWLVEEGFKVGDVDAGGSFEALCRRA